ncbi:MAG: hypothetical protein J0I15_03760 [Herbaspirillum huttiense]|uniref:hypothetical protein n=1 Tax=Herbaspirillum huttiense TaxID=863372 RepID=UPI001ACAF8FD|nr:hypothetical protein [Herbaspirillum huttiense]MBN9355545.1 hypothetical protein [Herbaspirillum huttiense]
MMNMSPRAFLLCLLMTISPMVARGQIAASAPEIVRIAPNIVMETLRKQAPLALKTVTNPPGVNFHTLSWKPPKLGKVLIDQGEKSIEVPHVRSLQGADDRWFPEENITSWNIIADVSAMPQISDDQARKTVYAFLRDIATKGWTPLIDGDDPRLTGKERFDYVIHQSSASNLNVDYEPTLQEWMALEDMSHWSFQGNDAFLTVSMRRGKEKADAKQPHVYLLLIALTGRNEHFRAYVAPKDRLRWRSLLPAALKQLENQRAANEAAAIARGMEIDRKYRDPVAPLP